MVAYKRPAIDARSDNGNLSKSFCVANTCPNGEGSLGNAEEEKTGAVASKPAGE